MNALQSGLAGVIVAGLAWWALAPGDLDGPELAQIQRPPADNKAGPAELLLARWNTSQRFGVFPVVEVGADVAQAGPLRLQGTAASPVRQAALISVGGAKPQWLVMGEPAAGLELMELSTGRAVVRTTSGETVTLNVFEAATPNDEPGAHATN